MCHLQVPLDHLPHFLLLQLDSSYFQNIYSDVWANLLNEHLFALVKYIFSDCKKKLDVKSIIVIENIYILHKKKYFRKNIFYFESITSRLSGRLLS